MNEEMVSIIIPVFNSEKYLEDTINCIINQTYQNYEAIFVDDFSKDNSVRIIEKHMKANSKFKLIKINNHIGVSRCRNIAIRNAKGRYITFLDSDDIWQNEKLEKQLEFIKRKKVGFVYCSFRALNNEGTKIGKKINIPQKLNYKKALLNTRILTITAMIDLNVIPKRYCYMPNVMNEDMATWWKILKKGYVAYGQNEVLAYYRKSKKSRSSKKMKTAFYRWKLYRDVEKISIFKSMFCFINYSINAVWKRLSFYKNIPKYNYNNLQVGLSTRNLKNNDELEKLIKKMNIKSHYLIINQSENSNVNDKYVINKNEKGLSKSRNCVINNATNDIVLLADDDVTYNDEYKKIIVDAYNKYDNADVICFYVESTNTKRKTKRMRTGKVGLIKSMKIVSFEITFKKDAILKNNLKFNEEFGAGTKLNRGEEQIFLCDALRKGLKILFVNKKIGEVSQEESTWFTKMDKDFFTVQGKVFRKMSPKFYKILIFQYAIRKYFLYHKNISFRNAYLSMLDK